MSKGFWRTVIFVGAAITFTIKFMEGPPYDMLDMLAVIAWAFNVGTVIWNRND